MDTEGSGERGLGSSGRSHWQAESSLALEDFGPAPLDNAVAVVSARPPPSSCSFRIYCRHRRNSQNYRHYCGQRPEIPSSDPGARKGPRVARLQHDCTRALHAVHSSLTSINRPGEPPLIKIQPRSFPVRQSGQAALIAATRSDLLSGGNLYSRRLLHVHRSVVKFIYAPAGVSMESSCRWKLFLLENIYLCTRILVGCVHARTAAKR